MQQPDYCSRPITRFGDAIAGGLKSGLATAAAGIASGVVGLVAAPIVGAKQEGAAGFAKGLATGTRVIYDSVCTLLLTAYSTTEASLEEHHVHELHEQQKLLGSLTAACRWCLWVNRILEAFSIQHVSTCPSCRHCWCCGAASGWCGGWCSASWQGHCQPE